MELAVQDIEISDGLSLPLNSISVDSQKLSQQLIFKTLTGEKFQIFITTEPLQEQQTTQESNASNCNQTAYEEPQQQVLEKPKLKKEVERKDPSIKCPLCLKVFDKLSKYRYHVKQHQNPKKFQCDLCGFSFNKEVNYKIHRALHNNGPVVCPICDRRFKRNASLKAHLVIHEVEETFSCLHCKVEFDKEDELLQHLEVHEGEEIDLEQKETHFNCDYCNYVFEDAEKLREHLQLHIQAKRFVNSGRSRLKRKGKPREYAHKCKQCNKSFAKLCLLLRHQFTHTGEKPFLCTICKKSFSQKGALQIHRRRHEGYKPHKCMFCPSSFVQKGNLKAHLQKTHTASKPDEKMYKCSHCTCVFKKLSSLNGHVTRIHSNCIQDNDEPDIMNVISQLKELNGQSASTQQQHQDQTQDMHASETQNGIQRQNQGLIYDNNTLTVDTSQHFNPHEQQTHDNIQTSRVSYVKIADSSIKGSYRNYIIKQRTFGEHRWYLCSYCNKEFKKPSDLIRHLRIHTREKPYKCSECGLTFAQKSTVNNHMATHVKNEFECAICKKNFGSMRSLNTHLKKHDQTAVARRNPSYKCSGCEKTFDTWETANLHMKLHEVVPDESLLLIEKDIETSTRVNMLQPLIETDQGLFPIPPPKPKVPLASYEEYKDRQFKCHVCDAVFVRGAHLRKHMFKHSTRRDFVCPVCSKQFAAESVLKDHLANHTKPKKYACSDCNKAFLNASMLQRHMISHKTVKLYICPYCKKRFRAKEHCWKHISRHKLTAPNLIFPQNNDGNMNESNINEDPSDLISFNNLLNEINLQEDQTLELVEENDLALEPVSGISGTTKEQNSAQINIQEGGTTQWFYNCEDYQLLANSETGLAPQINLQNSDESLLNQITNLQEPTTYGLIEENPSIILGTEGQMTIHADTFNPNVIFNPTFDIELTPIPKSHDSEFTGTVDIPNDKQLPIDINAIISDKSTEGTETSIPDQLILNSVNESSDNTVRDMNYFNISLKDFLEGSQLQLPPEYVNTKIDSLLICTKCNGRISNLDVLHECPPDIIDTTLTSETISEEPSENNPPEGKTPLNDIELAKNELLITFTCSKCSKQFNDIKGLNRHMSAKHKTAKNNTCPFCCKQIDKKSDMDRHIRTHTGEKPFACTKCDKAFAIKSTLMSHMRTHDPNDIKEFQCKVCNSRFRTKSTLKIHMIIHTDKQPFRCEICDKTFKHNHHLKTHLQTHENKSKKTSSNTKMTAVNFLQSLVFETNDKIHEEQRKQQTESVPEEIIPTENLFSQQLPVFGDNMDPVTITVSYDSQLQFKIDDNMVIPCDKTDYLTPEAEFVQPSMKEKKFRCDICDKFYVSNSVLRKHRRALHGDYKCDKCSKAFNSIELLEKHYISHNGPRPFPCTVCTNSFCNEASLKVHLKRMHPSDQE